MNHFEYKGYLGSAEIDVESRVLVGKLLFLRDVVAYSGTDVNGLEAAFREAVDEYLATCAELGDEPDVPCKGSFNVRVGAPLHREIALKARARGIGLNEMVCEALREACNGKSEHHTHVVVRVEAPRNEVVTGSAGDQRWMQEHARVH